MRPIADGYSVEIAQGRLGRVCIGTRQVRGDVLELAGSHVNTLQLSLQRGKIAADRFVLSGQVLERGEATVSGKVELDAPVTETTTRAQKATAHRVP